MWMARIIGGIKGMWDNGINLNKMAKRQKYPKMKWGAPEGIWHDSGIYKITNTVNGKFYIGQAISLRKRYTCHNGFNARGEATNIYLQNSWDKHGAESFIFEVIELCEIAQLDAKEQYWLDILKPFGERGYNANFLARSSKGRKLTPEQRASNLVRAQNRGVEYTLVSPKGETYTGKCLAVFAREHSLHKGMLQHVVSGRVKFYKGWHLPGEVPRQHTRNEYPVEFKFCNSLGDLSIIQPADLTQFCLDNKLDRKEMVKMWRGKSSHLHGWTRFDENRFYVFIKNQKGDEIKCHKTWPDDFSIKFNLDKLLVKKLLLRKILHLDGWYLKDREESFLKELSGEKQPKKWFYKNNPFKLISPEGKLYESNSAESFAKEHNLNDTQLRLFLQGVYKSCKGWRKPTERDLIKN